MSRWRTAGEVVEVPHTAGERFDRLGLLVDLRGDRRQLERRMLGQHLKHLDVVGQPLQLTVVVDARIRQRRQQPALPDGWARWLSSRRRTCQ